MALNKGNFNSEDAIRTDSVIDMFKDPTDVHSMTFDTMIYMWIAAFISRGKIQSDRSTVEFKFDDNTEDKFNDIRSELLSKLDTVLVQNEDIGDIIKKSKDGSKYVIDKNSTKTDFYRDSDFFNVFKYWMYNRRSIPAALIASKDQVHTFLYVYGILRGKSYEKNIRGGKSISVSRVYGNTYMIRQYLDLLYAYMTYNNLGHYIPKIKSGKKEPSIELGPKMTDIIFGTNYYDGIS